MHLERWNYSRTNYDNAWKTLRDLVAQRPRYMMNYIQETFEFSDAEMEAYFGESLRLIEVYEALHG